MAFTEKIKFEVKKLSHHTCCVCKSIGVEIHHIIPQAEKGPDTLENAAPLCPSCHEIYGQNPTKRKFIRETRDIWYEICQSRYKADTNQLNEIFQKVSNIEDDISKLISKKSKIDSEPLTIGGIFDIFYAIPFPSDSDQLKSYELSFALIFETTGQDDDEGESLINNEDQTALDDLEFNELRDYFISYFGEQFSRKFLLHSKCLTELNWNKGVTELNISEFIGKIYIRMFLIMMNHDLDIFDSKLEARLRDDGEFEYVTIVNKEN